jgi:hypothetical protein
MANRCDWSKYTEEQKARYNAQRRMKYAERGDYYIRTVERNKAWLEKNRADYNRKKAERRKSDQAWREEQNAKRRGRDQRHHQLKSNYGITKAQYDAMHLAQDGRCAICGVKPNETLCVDHCHSTGLVRALLCRACNTGLGCFKDDLSLFGRAMGYLEKWR